MYLTRGSCLGNFPNKIDAAISDATYVLENLDQLNIPALSIRATALRKIGRYEEAAIDFQKVVSLHEPFGHIYSKDLADCLRLSAQKKNKDD